MEASESVPLQNFKLSEQSALLFWWEQEERSYPFDRFYVLQASKSVPPQDYNAG